MQKTAQLGTENIGKLLIKLGIPASIGFVAITIYNLTDTLFVGKFIGPLAIAAVAIAGPVSVLIAAMGYVLGVGGSSIISRALGAKDEAKASHVFGNQIVFSLIFSFVMMGVGWLLEKEALTLFGARGAIYPHAVAYFRIVLVAGIPFLTFNSMARGVINALGKTQTSMKFSMISAVINIILDPIFIIALDWGIEGAAIATTLAFMVETALMLRFFLSGKEAITIQKKYFKLNWPIVKEMLGIGISALANQVVMSAMIIVLNYSLFKYGKENGVAIYGIINRFYMLFFIPIMAVEAGFRPIVGYSYGANNMDRVKKSIKTALNYSMLTCLVLVIGIVSTSHWFIHLFTDEPFIIEHTPYALNMVIALAPLLALEMISVALFQSINKPKLAIIQLVFKYAILVIPMVLILPIYFSWQGIIYAFPIAEFFAALLTIWLLMQEFKVLNQRMASSTLQKEKVVVSED
ncbi:MAG: MATE family efflux transporter [Flammeovirgaceae bacterium]